MPSALSERVHTFYHEQTHGCRRKATTRIQITRVLPCSWCQTTYINSEMPWLPWTTQPHFQLSMCNLGMIFSWGERLLNMKFAQLPPWRARPLTSRMASVSIPHGNASGSCISAPAARVLSPTKFCVCECLCVCM